MINAKKALKNRPIPKTEGQRLVKRIWDYREMYLLLLPSIIYVFIFSYMPMYGIIIGFQDMKIGEPYGTSTWVGLYHFKRFLDSIYLWPLLRNTMAISLLSIFLGTPITLLFSVMLHNSSNKFIKKAVQNITYIPNLLSIVIIVSILRLFVANDSGLINVVRINMGLENIDFFSRPEYFLPMYYISGTWQSLGSSAIIFLGALSGVDEEMMEAARIDGANKARIIWNIQLPSILPTIVTITILNFGSVFSVGTDKALLMQTDLNLDASEIIGTYVYKEGIMEARYSYTTAVGMLQNVTNIVMLVIVNFIADKLTGLGIL